MSTWIGICRVSVGLLYPFGLVLDVKARDYYVLFHVLTRSNPNFL